MNADQVAEILKEAIQMIILISGPILLIGLVVGVITNIFQAVTQINETTVAIIPKMMAMVLAIVLLSSWILHGIEDYTIHVFENISTLSK